MNCTHNCHSLFYTPMIQRNYEPQRISRPQTLVSGGNIASLGTGVAKGFRTVEQNLLPAARSAGLFAARQIGRAATSQLKTLGQGAGIAAGIGAAALTGQPELLPYAAAAGGLAGGEAGKYLQASANKAIDRWR